MHGDETEALLTQVVKLMRHQFPDAQNFGASRTYWPRAVVIRNKEHRRSKEAQHAAVAQADRDRQLADQQAKRNHLRERWKELDEHTQQQILTLVKRQGSDFVARAVDAGRTNDPLVVLACLNILEAQSASHGDA